MTPLPPLSEVEGLLDANGQSAWRRVLEAEEIALASSANTVAKYNDLLVDARVIGFFILDFKMHSHSIPFTERAHHNLVEQVHACWTNLSAEECLKKVIGLGTLLRNHLIRACMLRVLLS